MMHFFSKEPRHSGWMSISFQADGIHAAHVLPASAGGRPTVEWLAFYASSESERTAALSRLEKDRRSGSFQCTHLLGIGEYQIMSMDAPAVPMDELKSAVRWRLKDMLDYHIDDATIDVLRVPADKGLAARSSTLFAIAARNQIIQQRQEMFDDAKMAVRVIDIPDMAQRNLSALIEPEGKALAMLSVNDDGALVTVTYGGELYFSRNIDVKSAQLQQPNGDPAVFWERIALQLQRSLDFFDRQYPSAPLAKLVLAPTQNGDGLKDYLSSNLYIPVETLDLPSVIDVSKVPELRAIDTQQRFLLTIGAALRREEKVL